MDDARYAEYAELFRGKDFGHGMMGQYIRLLEVKVSQLTHERDAARQQSVEAKPHMEKLLHVLEWEQRRAHQSLANVLDAQIEPIKTWLKAQEGQRDA